MKAQVAGCVKLRNSPVVQLLSCVWLFETPCTAALLCPSLSLGVCSNSCPLSRWCHAAISSSVVPFSCPQSFPASGSFPMSLFFTSGGQSIGVSASASFLPMNIQDWFPLGLTGFISLHPRDSQEYSPTPQLKSINSSLSPGLCSDLCPLSRWCCLTILCCPFLLLPSVFPSIRVFFNELALHIRWSENWSFSFSISPPSEYSGLISFRIDWFDLLTVQRTQESSPASQFKSINSSMLSMVQLSHSYMITGKMIDLTIWTFVSKVMFLLLYTLSRFVIALLPRNKHLLISWPQSLSAVILEPKKIKSVTVSSFSPSICHEVMDWKPRS